MIYHDKVLIYFSILFAGLCGVAVGKLFDLAQ
jgi:hypothetical protein